MSVAAGFHEIVSSPDYRSILRFAGRGTRIEFVRLNILAILLHGLGFSMMLAAFPWAVSWPGAGAGHEAWMLFVNELAAEVITSGLALGLVAAAFVLQLAAGVRRNHDLGRSGWCVRDGLIALLFFAGQPALARIDGLPAFLKGFVSSVLPILLGFAMIYWLFNLAKLVTAPGERRTNEYGPVPGHKPSVPPPPVKPQAMPDVMAELDRVQADLYHRELAGSRTMVETARTERSTSARETLKARRQQRADKRDGRRAERIKRREGKQAG